MQLYVMVQSPTLRVGLNIAGKRANYLSVQLSHHVPCLNSEVSRIRTGYEMTIAHRSSEDFSFIAKQDGKVTSIDNDLKLLKVEYVAQAFATVGTLTLPYGDIALRQALTYHTPLVVLMTQVEYKTYPAHRVFSVASDVNVEVIETIAFPNIDAVPDKTARKYMSAELTRAIKHTPLIPVEYVRLNALASHAPAVVDLFQFGPHYTNVSGSYLQQELVVNVTQGDAFKRGDVLAYNAGFFSPDPDSKQVNWNHGVMADVALIEMGATLEDSCMITKELGARLRMSPAHVRQIEITANTAVHAIVSVGDHVETTDQLCVIEEGDIEALSGDDAATLSFLSNLNRKVMRAKYHGSIAEINLYYSCAPDTLHPTLIKLIKTLDRAKQRYAAAAQHTLKEEHYLTSRQVAPGTKYHGVVFENDTVVLLITISEDISAGIGDKICYGLQAKSVIGEVMERAPSSESGVAIGSIFSCSSIARRILSSPYLIGIGNRVLEKMEDQVTSTYFAKE